MTFTKHLRLRPFGTRSEVPNREVVGSIFAAGSSRKVFIREATPTVFPFRTCLLSMAIPPTRPHQIQAVNTTEYLTLAIPSSKSTFSQPP